MSRNRKEERFSFTVETGDLERLSFFSGNNRDLALAVIVDSVLLAVSPSVL